MILITEGECNIYYLQTLCMLFFPGAKFPEGEQETAETPVVTMSVKDTGEGIESYCKIKVGSRIKESTRTELFSDFSEREKCIKISMGVAVFEAGKKFFGFSPPWGILIGVRPTKIVGDMISQGMDTPSIKRRLTKEYFLNPKKAALAINVAKNEQKLLKHIPKDTCSLYISLPFCPSRCNYCSFVSYSTKRLFDLIPEYLERLREDIIKTVDLINKMGMRILTVYIGGGTPTILTEEQLSGLLGLISDRVDTSLLIEYSLEAGRPDTITREKMKIAVDNGITRVSVNTQTLSNHVLEEIGRKHTAEDYYKAFSIARQSGVKCINTDLIAGLPGEGFTLFSRSVDGVIALRPENITVHSFCIKKAADILQTERDIYNRSSIDTVKSVDYSQLKTKLAGYSPYYMYRQKNTSGNLENVGFSLDGHEGIYNVLIMKETHSIFACGAGAVTKIVKDGGKKIKRFFMPKYPFEYLSFASNQKLSDSFYNSLEMYHSRQT